MSQLSDVQTFITASRKARTIEDVREELIDITLEMGFQHVSLAHHVDLRGDAFSRYVAVGNYPAGFIEDYLAQERHVIDPGVVASHHTSVGFLWSELGTLIEMTEPQREMLNSLRRFGFDEGLTVPYHVPGEANGSCRFVTRIGQPFPHENRMMAQLVGPFAFEAARRIIRRQQGRARPTTGGRLTQRQLECVLLVARGKTNKEIAGALGIKPDTVVEYLEDARRLYDARNRTDLAFRAVYDGAFTLSDVLRDNPQ